jgi:hypothetical protein
MLSAWTQHLRNDPEAKEKFEDYVKNSNLLVRRLQDMIDQVIGDIERSERSTATFSNPNWAYLQAYYNGEVAALEKLKKIVSIDQNEQPVRPNKPTDPK